jgi:hypothetical protein
MIRMVQSGAFFNQNCSEGLFYKEYYRCQAELKNKFYSINRSFIRQFVKFMNKKKITKVKIPSANLSSKLISDIYQGRKSIYLCICRVWKIQGFY